MKDTNVEDPQFTDENCTEFLRRLGMNIADESNIRKSPNMILYGFADVCDYREFSRYLKENNITYAERTSEGARFPHQAILNNDN